MGIDPLAAFELLQLLGVENAGVAAAAIARGRANGITLGRAICVVFAVRSACGELVPTANCLGGSTSVASGRDDLGST